VKPSDETYTYCLQDIEMTRALYTRQLVYTNYRRRRPGPRKRRALKALRKKKREGLCSCLVGLCWHAEAGDVYHLADCPLWTRRNPRPSWEERQT
jgi:hypothetical protein